MVIQLLAGRDKCAMRGKMLKVRQVNCMETSHGVLQTGSSEEPLSAYFISPCAGRVKDRHHDNQS